ncbi:unnamed protein product, partial [Meganyctiphanes norvegica]
LQLAKHHLQDSLKQLQTQLLFKTLLKNNLPIVNNPLQLNALNNLQSLETLTPPNQILQAKVLRTLHNLKRWGNQLPVSQQLGDKIVLPNNIINSLLTSNLAMNRITNKRSTENLMPFREMGLARNLVQPENTAKTTNIIPELSGKLELIRNLVQPVNDARLTNNINANNVPEPSGKIELTSNIVQPENTARFANDLNANNIPDLSVKLELLRNLLSQSAKAGRFTKSINNNDIPGPLATLQGIQTSSQTEALSLNSKEKSENKNLENQDEETIKNLLDDSKNIAKEYDHINSNEKSLTKTSEKSQAGSVSTEKIIALPDKDIQLEDTLHLRNIYKRHLNSNIRNSDSSTDALSKESESRDSLTSNHSNGGLQLASQLLKEARSDLSTIDNIISSYSINENTFSELSSKINEDRSVISQENIRSDFSFDGIRELGPQNNLKAVIDRKLNNEMRYNDKSSSEEGSIKNSSEKTKSTDKLSQLESLLRSRLETANKLESKSSVMGSNDETTDNPLEVVSKLVSEAHSDISKIQDDLKETFFLESVKQINKRETKPQQMDILKATNLLNNANLDLSTLHESLRTAKTLKDIKFKYSDSEVINHRDRGFIPSVDDILIGSDAEYANSLRVKRVLNDQDFF